MTVDMISSSPNEKAAKSNLDVFTLALMLMSETKSGTPKDR